MPRHTRAAIERIIANGLVHGVLATLLAAQGAANTAPATLAQFAERLSITQGKIDAKEWNAALDLLVTLRGMAKSDAEREQVAAGLASVGEALGDGGSHEQALRAHTAALELRQLVHRTEDHRDVANSMVWVASCLDYLGRARDALPKFEIALAMYQRLHDGADDLEVAQTMGNMASCLQSLGRSEEASSLHGQALAMKQRICGGSDDARVAQSMHNLAVCLQSMGKSREALPYFEESLAMNERLHGGEDRRDVAACLYNLAGCLQVLGRMDEALAKYLASMAMQERLFGKSDRLSAVRLLNALVMCLNSLGRFQEALSCSEEALAMSKRICGEGDSPDVATSSSNVASCLGSLGRSVEALPNYQASLAMYERLAGGRDDATVVAGLNNLAACQQALGCPGDALPHFENSLAMSIRLSNDHDDMGVAQAFNNAATCLQKLGRVAEALPMSEASLAMTRRILRDADHPYLASRLHNLAICLLALGRAGEAMPHVKASLAMNRRLYSGEDHVGIAHDLAALGSGSMMLERADEALEYFAESLAVSKRIYQGADHPDVAMDQHDIARCLSQLGRPAEALPSYDSALAMLERLYGKTDHPSVAALENDLGTCLVLLGRLGDALPRLESGLSMLQRIHGALDHPDTAASLNNLAGYLERTGHVTDALPYSRQAVGMMERVRDRSKISPELKQSLFDQLKQTGAFERLQSITAELGETAESWLAAERSRGRGLLDLVQEQSFDAMEEAQTRARQRGDLASANRLDALRTELASTELEGDRLLHQLTQADPAHRQELLAQSNAVAQRNRQLLDERARLFGSVLPVGEVHPATEVQARLRTGEVFLEFTITKAVHLLYVLGAQGDVEVLPLPTAFATVQSVLPALLASCSHSVFTMPRGRDPDVATTDVASRVASRDLFRSLIPAALWPRLQAANRVFIAAHRSLHRLPFELLVTDVNDGKPVYWLDSGPEIAYVPSGSVLHWLRERRGVVATAPAELDLLAIGDPGAAPVELAVPDHGALIAAVPPGGQGQRLGLEPHDVLVSYDGKAIADPAMLGTLRKETEAAIDAGTRPDATIPLEVWRSGETLRFELQRGLLGVQVAPGKPQLAYEGALGREAEMERIQRAGDLERIRRLPHLRGAAAEAKAITSAWVAKGRAARALIGEQATEAGVFDLAAHAHYLHFACHGIAEEYVGQSLSMLVLSQPEHVLSDDDGLLKLGDLLNHWRGRLDGCRLVVLSACSTNVGPTLRDEAPQALPIGFLFAGAPSVISSLWAVDDTSTRELMVDFYARLLAAESDKLAAFTAAKKALRAKYPDPFHWAPFLYMGRPE